MGSIIHRCHRFIPGFLLLAGACAAPAPREDQGGGRVLLDDSGVRTVLAAPARRVVSLSPSFTELLFALGTGDRLVGRTTWCDFPAEALAVPSLGDGLEPNVELILSARPDLVLLYRSPRNSQAAERLRGLGIAALELRIDALDDVRRAARLLGRALAREAAAEELVTRFDRELEAISRVAGPGALSVLALAWDHPPIVIGSGSFLGELLEAAGARNVFADLAVPSAPVSLEAIAARDPGLILVTADSTTLESRPEWRTVPAVRQRRFLRLTGSEFARPTPRAPDAIRRLRAALDSANPP